MSMRYKGGIISAIEPSPIRLATAGSGSGIWTTTQYMQSTQAAGPVGGSSSNPGASAAQIKALTGTTTNGLYWIMVNGVARQVYCDMSNDGGGWMLWLTFGTSAAYQSGYALYPDITAWSQLTALGWTTNDSPGCGTDYISYGLACYASGYIQTNVFNGISGPPTPTYLRTSISNVHVGWSNFLDTNGVNRGSAGAGGVPVTLTSVPVNFSGTTPIIKYYEDNAIPKLFWIMYK